VDFLTSQDSEQRFESYIDALAGVLGHADRRAPLQGYCAGLLLPGERKSVEPMAAVTAPARVAAQHQTLLHFVGQGPWSDETLLAKVRDLALPAVQRHGPIEAWIIDDTLCIAAYGFLISERETIPPSGYRAPTGIPQPAVPDRHRPRGPAPSPRATLSELNTNHAP
jgi:hypothetical protein